jgi:hypothetical protein
MTGNPARHKASAASRSKPLGGDATVRLTLKARDFATAEGLTQRACLALQAAVLTLQLTLARDGRSAVEAADVFDSYEIEILQHILPTLEGKTEKQKNPHRAGSLAQAAWIIARLGGWKG